MLDFSLWIIYNYFKKIVRFKGTFSGFLLSDYIQIISTKHPFRLKLLCHISEFCRFALRVEVRERGREREVHEFTIKRRKSIFLPSMISCFPPWQLLHGSPPPTMPLKKICILLKYRTRWCDLYGMQIHCCFASRRWWQREHWDLGLQRVRQRRKTTF